MDDSRVSWRPRLRQLHPVLLLLLAAFAVVLVRTAWVSDDAYITFRTIENFLNGYGLRYNAAERVQSYTHPLWLLLLIPFRLAAGDAYAASLALSFACTLFAIATLVFAAARGFWQAILGLLALSFSKAFVDYSTSGLENPLSHALVGVFFILYAKETHTRRARTLLYFVAALVALTRMDLALVVIPAGIDVFRRAPHPREVAAGATPFLLWEAFSIVYYGFPFPNTAYAKLSTGIPRTELLERGLFYFASSFATDPWTLALVGGVLVWAVLGRRRHRPSYVMMAGVGLYLVCVVYIGGDFMAGRFFSAAVFVAVLTLVHRIELEAGARRAVALAVILLVGLASPALPVWSGSEAGLDRSSLRDRHGIADERAFYYPYTGLLRAHRQERAASHPWALQGSRAREDGEAVVIRDTVGLFGYYAGSEVHVVDFYALTDPLLARLPARANPNFRPGHFTRAIPAGYYETLVGGSNALEDRPLSRFYACIAAVTRGDLFSFERLRAIFRLNFESLPADVDFTRYRYFGRERLPLEAMDSSAPIRRMTGSGLRIEISRPRHDALVEMGLDCDDDYRVLYYLGETPVGTTDVPSLCPGGDGAIERRTVTAPFSAIERGYDALWVLPTRGARPFRIAHVTVVR